MVPPATKTNMVFLAIRKRILDRVVAPGTRIRPAHLEQHFGVSKGPVMDALYNLEREGYLRLEGGNAFFVTPWGEREVREVFTLRAALEGQIGETLIELADKGLIDMIDREIAEMEGALAGDVLDPERFVTAFRRLDTNAVLATDNRLLIEKELSLLAPSIFRRSIRALSRRNMDFALGTRQLLRMALELKDASYTGVLINSCMLTQMHLILGHLRRNPAVYRDDWLTEQEDDGLGDGIRFSEGGLDEHLATPIVARGKRRL